MSAIGGRLGCTRVIRGELCGLPKLHGVHCGSTMDHEYRKPDRKQRREAMAAKSDKMQVYYDEVRIPAVQAIQGTPCEAGCSNFIDLPERYRCTGVAVDIHEIVRRTQAGNLPLAVELGTLNVCRPCHDFISNEPKAARELGYSLSRKDVGLT